jgi:crossover junction endodeoxyribonuclease RuvC
MRILGIDPGLRTTGFGVIDVEGSQQRYVASGTISTAAAGARLPARLKVLFEGVQEVVHTYRPDCASVEIVFVNVNPQSTLLLGQARGACVTALVAHDLPVHEYTALQLKQAVAGHGRADKAAIQQMVARLLKLPGLPGKDAADALGLAITHAHAGGAMMKLARAHGAAAGLSKDAAESARKTTRAAYRAGRPRV